MGGEVSKNFHEKVTHLVAGEVGSKKYIVSDYYTDVWNSVIMALLSVKKTPVQSFESCAILYIKLVCSLYVAPVHSAVSMSTWL